MQLEKLRSFVFAEEQANRINTDTANEIIRIIDENLLDRASEVGVQPEVKQKLAAILKHLESSFNKANKHLDENNIKTALSELVISNAEARQVLSKFSA